MSLFLLSVQITFYYFLASMFYTILYRSNWESHRLLGKQDLNEIPSTLELI